MSWSYLFAALRGKNDFIPCSSSLVTVKLTGTFFCMLTSYIKHEQISMEIIESMTSIQSLLSSCVQRRNGKSCICIKSCSKHKTLPFLFTEKTSNVGRAKVSAENLFCIRLKALKSNDIERLFHYSWCHETVECFFHAMKQSTFKVFFRLLAYIWESIDKNSFSRKNLRHFLWKLSEIKSPWNCLKLKIFFIVTGWN